MTQITLIASIIVFMAGMTYAAGTATVVDFTKTSWQYTVRWECTGHTDGTVDDSSGATAGSNLINGYIQNIRVIPDDAGDSIFGGDHQPETDFRVELRCSSVDENGNQVFGIRHDVAYSLTSRCSNNAITEGMPVDPTNGGIVFLKDAMLNIYASGLGGGVDDLRKFIVEVVISSNEKNW